MISLYLFLSKYLCCAYTYHIIGRVNKYMNKKIISIGIIAVFLLMDFSTSTAITEEESEENIESDEYKGTYFMIKSIGCSGKGFAWKSFWTKCSNLPYIMFVHYDSLDYGFFITREGERTDFEGSCNVLIFGFSFGDIMNSLGYDMFHQGYGDWFGFLEPSSFGGLMIDMQYPFYVRLF